MIASAAGEWACVCVVFSRASLPCRSAHTIQWDGGGHVDLGGSWVHGYNSDNPIVKLHTQMKVPLWEGRTRRTQLLLDELEGEIPHQVLYAASTASANLSRAVDRAKDAFSAKVKAEKAERRAKAKEAAEKAGGDGKAASAAAAAAAAEGEAKLTDVSVTEGIKEAFHEITEGKKDGLFRRVLDYYRARFEQYQGATYEQCVACPVFGFGCSRAWFFAECRCCTMMTARRWRAATGNSRTAMALSLPRCVHIRCWFRF